MRYQSRVSEIANPHDLTHLSRAETRLSVVLARPKRIAILCVVALAGLCWISLGFIAAGSETWAVQIWAMLCRPAAAGDWSDLAIVAPMWAAMTLAMMLPTAGPMILTYAEIADTAARKDERVVSPLVLTAGYVAVWLGFALVATILQATLTRAALLDAGQAGVMLAGGIFVLAGLYQFSPLKHACLTQCQRPFPFFFSRWTTLPAGVFQLGLRQGLYCLGCCWAMMLLMFAVGVMNVIWMAGLGMIMTIEKMTATPRFAHVAGVAFMAIGAGLVVSGLV